MPNTKKRSFKRKRIIAITKPNAATTMDTVRRINREFACAPRRPILKFAA